MAREGSLYLIFLWTCLVNLWSFKYSAKRNKTPQTISGPNLQPLDPHRTHIQICDSSRLVKTTEVLGSSEFVGLKSPMRSIKILNQLETPLAGYPGYFKKILNPKKNKIPWHPGCMVAGLFPLQPEPSMLLYSLMPNKQDIFPLTCL